MRRTIKGKVTTVVVIIFVIFGFAMTYIGSRFMQTELMERQSELLQAQCEYYAAAVDKWADSEIQLTGSIATAVSMAGISNTKTLEKLMYKYFINNSELMNVYLGTPDGDFYMSNKSFEVVDGYDPRTRDWYIQAAAVEENGEPVVIDPYADAQTGIMVVTMASPLYVNHQFIGVVAIDVSLETLDEMIKSIDYEEGAYGFLIDSSECFVNYKDSALNPTEEGSLAVADYFPELAEHLEHEDVHELTDLDGSSMYFSNSKIAATGWTMVLAVPSTNVTNAIMRTINLFIVIAIISIAVAIFVVSRFISKLLEPIGRVVPAMERVAQGDFSMWLDFTAQNDELGELQNSMSLLIGVLSDIISEQKVILAEISTGNLVVENMDELPGDFNDIAESVNTIKVKLNENAKQLQLLAFSLQSTAIGLLQSDVSDEMRSLCEEMSREATELLNMANQYKTF